MGGRLGGAARCARRVGREGGAAARARATRGEREERRPAVQGVEQTRSRAGSEMQAVGEGGAGGGGEWDGGSRASAARGFTSFAWAASP